MSLFYQKDNGVELPQCCCLGTWLRAKQKDMGVTFELTTLPFVALVSPQPALSGHDWAWPCLLYETWQPVWLHRLLLWMSSAVCHCGALRAVAEMIRVRDIMQRYAWWKHANEWPNSGQPAMISAAPAVKTTDSSQAEISQMLILFIRWTTWVSFPVLFLEFYFLTRSCWNMEKSN